MPPYATTPPDAILYCTSCSARVLTKGTDIARLREHGRVTLAHATGSWERAPEYVTTECDDCMRKSLDAPELRAVGYEMALICGHVRQQLDRGVPLDEAIRYAVDDRTIRDELRRSTDFVEWLLVHGSIPHDDFAAWAETATAEEPTAVATDTSERPATLVAQAILMTNCPLCGSPGVARLDNTHYKCLTGCGRWFEVEG